MVAGDRHRAHELRAKLVAGFILSLFAGLLVRLVLIQAVEGERYRALARLQHRVRVPLAVRRGTIYDRYGRVLALSVQVPSIFANPRLIPRKRQVAHRLAELLGVDRGALLARLERRQETVCLKTLLTPREERRLRQCGLLELPGHVLRIANGALVARPTAVTDAKALAKELAPLMRRDPKELQADLEGFAEFVWVKRRVSDAERQRVLRAHDLPGLGVVPEYRRTYTQGKLAPQLLGFCGVDENGLEGLELKLDHTLAGERGYATFARDAGGRPISAPGLPRREPQRGVDVELTLDAVVQSYVEAALDEACELWAPKSASAVVIDPRTGDVLAAACRPTFDPNEYWEYETKELKKRARARYVVDWLEPGSVMKPFVLCGALAERLVREGTVIFCENGVWLLGPRRFHDHHAYGHLSVAEVITKSSNIGAAKLGTRLGARRLYHYLSAFGFGRPTGFVLPGENPGLLRPPHTWRRVYTVPSVSIGQEVCVNLLQMALGYAAIANDGVLMRPRLVRRLIHPDGRIEERPPEVARRVIPASIARRVRWVLFWVVEEGTGRRARLVLYSLGGKTGTAQKPLPGGGYAHDRVICSFAGMAPIERPRVVCMVAVDEPTKRTGGRHFGGTVAAPIVGRIMNQTLAYLGLPPDREAALARLAHTRPSKRVQR